MLHVCLVGFKKLVLMRKLWNLKTGFFSTKYRFSWYEIKRHVKLNMNVAKFTRLMQIDSVHRFTIIKIFTLLFLKIIS